MVSFVHGDLWIYNEHAKLLLLSVSVIEKPSVLVTQRIYSRLHSFTQHFVFTTFDMHRFTTLARKHEGNARVT